MEYIANLFRAKIGKAIGAKPLGDAQVTPANFPTTPPVTRAEGARLKVVLFIGHHKVGSSSLQDYLSQNAAALARFGVLYPYVDFEGMAYMAAAAAGHPTYQGSRLPMNIHAPHNALAFRMMAENENFKVPPWHKMLPALPQMEHAIRQQIRFSSPHTVILAGEVFANFNANSPESIKRLAKLFPGADFTIVATMRRIDEYLASWHGQRLKFGDKLSALRDDGINDYMNGIHFNYRLMIEGWIEGFPKARVILRNYADVCANGGSVADFLAQAEIDTPDGLIPERSQNSSFHRGTYEIIRRGNAELPKDKGQALRQMMHELASFPDLPLSKKIELFGLKNRQSLVQKFKPIDRYLGEFVGRDGFFADLDQALEPLEISENDAYRAALDRIGKMPEVGRDHDIFEFLSKLDESINYQPTGS